jgi:hypothetical protein
MSPTRDVQRDTETDEGATNRPRWDRRSGREPAPDRPRHRHRRGLRRPRQSAAKGHRSRRPALRRPQGQHRLTLNPRHRPPKMGVPAEGTNGMTSSNTHDPEYASPEDTRLGGDALESGANPLFAGVGDLCTELPRPVGVDGVAVAVLSPATQSRELVCATDVVALRLDELQYTLGEGPCFDAYLENYPQFYPQLDIVGDAPRWPTFAADATQLGVHAVFAFPLPDGQRPMGVLELYRCAPAPSPRPNTAVRQPSRPRSEHAYR